MLDFTLSICLRCSTSSTIFFVCHSGFSQFLSFKVFFKHFCVFWNMNLAFHTNFFGVVFLLFMSLHTCEQNILCHQNCTYKVDFMFFVILPYFRTFGAWGEIFLWFFKSETYVFQNKDQPIFFFGDYGTCTVLFLRSALELIICLDNTPILFFSVCCFCYWSYPHLFQKIFAYPMNITFSMRYQKYSLKICHEQHEIYKMFSVMNQKLPKTP